MTRRRHARHAAPDKPDRFGIPKAGDARARERHLRDPETCFASVDRCRTSSSHITFASIRQPLYLLQILRLPSDISVTVGIPRTSKSQPMQSQRQASSSSSSTSSPHVHDARSGRACDKCRINKVRRVTTNRQNRSDRPVILYDWLTSSFYTVVLLLTSQMKTGVNDAKIGTSIALTRLRPR